jgi:hypothetical protein
MASFLYTNSASSLTIALSLFDRMGLFLNKKIERAIPHRSYSQRFDKAYIQPQADVHPE